MNGIEAEKVPVKLQNKILSEFEKEESMKRLPKRMAYILRYGALKEGLQVDDNGYVLLDDLVKVGLLQDYTKEEILDNVKTSVSYRKTQRYDWRMKDGQYHVRAAYLRNFEKNPCHFGTQVPTLFERSMTYILSNLDDYDLQDFPDEYTIRLMIRRLKREKKLSNKTLKVLLVPTVTRLDLEGVYLTKNTLQLVWTQCPHLKAVSLKDCGYIMTDNVLAQFTKNLPNLERLNLCSCSHLTHKCLSILLKQCPHLQVLHIARVPSLTFETVLDFIKKAETLNFLDVYYLRTTPQEYDTLMQTAKEKGVNLVLREPRRRKEETLTTSDEVSEKSDDTDSEESQSASRHHEYINDMMDANVEHWAEGDRGASWEDDDPDVWYESYDHVYVQDAE